MSAICEVCGLDRLQYKATAFGGSICNKCETLTERKPFKLEKTPEEMKHEKEYKMFLKGELYPEIKVKHATADGKCSTNARLKDSTKFFKVKD